ncbi:hypothetical protein [Gemmatimonas sp.]|uniref:hypothetical protein n=1 Tax=Gemmatimonas sp. TaxID=1962908 RepID=UPI003983292A
MVEINITKKESSWVPWLIGAIVVGALIWFMAMRNSPNSATAERNGAYDSNSAAGTLSSPRDSAMMRMDSMRTPPPR